MIGLVTPSAHGATGVEEFDVVVVGYGPGAQALCGLLGRTGHRVLAFERFGDLYNNSRAGHIDHEALRTVQAVTAEGAKTLEATMMPPLQDYQWINGHGEVLFTQPHVHAAAGSVSGWYADYTMWQPVMEDVLYEASRDIGVEVAFGWEVTAVIDTGEHVEVTANRVNFDRLGRRESTEEYRTIRARFAVGADGAGSFVRRTLGIARTDQDLDEQWLVVDCLTLDEDHVMVPYMAQIADPRRPALVMPLGRRHRRFEWALLPGETREQMLEPAVAWDLLSTYRVTPQTHEIARQVVYRFQAREAQSWHRGRVFILGDAAHTMPPYAGQGLCSAVRDAANLAWKLDLVLRGVSAERLMDTYELERRPHVATWTGLSIAEGRVSNVLDVDEAERRDEQIRERGLPHPDLPKLEAGVLYPSPGVGEIAPQGVVTKDGTDDLLESHFVGPAFWLVSLDADLDAAMSPESTRILSTIGARVVSVVSAGTAGHVVDVGGAYRRWFENTGAVAVLYRPDFHIYATLTDLRDLDSVVAQLGADLGLASPNGLPLDAEPAGRLTPTPTHQ